MKKPDVVSPGASSEQPVENSVPGIDAAMRAQLEAARGEPVPERLHDLAADLGEALDRRRKILDKRNKTSR
jgi:hypothetical protein